MKRRDSLTRRDNFKGWFRNQSVTNLKDLRIKRRKQQLASKTSH
jgi:hypothetical protein